MATTPSDAGTPADPAAPPQAGDPPAPAADAQQPQAGSADSEGGSGSESISLDEAKKLRSEANSLRKRLAAFEQADKARADAEKTDLDKANERITELERANGDLVAARRDDALRISAAAQARTLGFRAPDLAYRLLDGVEFDDAGQPTNVQKLLEALAKAQPDLVNAAPDFGGGPRGKTPSNAPSMNDLLRAAAGGG